MYVIFFLVLVTVNSTNMFSLSYQFLPMYKIVLVLVIVINRLLVLVIVINRLLVLVIVINRLLVLVIVLVLLIVNFLQCSKVMSYISESR